MGKKGHQCFCNSVNPYICEMLMNTFQPKGKYFSKEPSLYLDNCYTFKQQWCPCRSPLNDALIHTFTFRLWRLILPSFRYVQLPQNPNLLLIQMALHSPHCCMHNPQKARQSKNEQSLYKHSDPLAEVAAKRLWFM